MKKPSSSEKTAVTAACTLISIMGARLAVGSCTSSLQQPRPAFVTTKRKLIGYTILRLTENGLYLSFLRRMCQILELQFQPSICFEGLKIPPSVQLDTH